MTRRHDLDALRVIAFGLLILYHCSMLYVFDWDWHIKSSYQAEWLQWPMLAMNRWRMALLFIISGLAIGLFDPSRAPGRFAWMRTKRVLLPLVFGMFVILPVQPYCQGVVDGVVEPGFGVFLMRYWELQPWPAGVDYSEYDLTWNHLWYLAYLWVYTLVLTALLPLLESNVGKKLQGLLTNLRGARLVLLPALPLVLYIQFLMPRFESSNDLFGDWFQHAQFFTIFLYGYVMARSQGLWDELVRMRRSTLAIALLLGLVYVPLVLTTPDDASEALLVFARTLRGLYLWAALLAILGWAKVLLDRPFRWLPYASEAVYPWYILHQSLTVLLAYWLVPMALGPAVEPLLVVSGTVMGCVLLHEFVVRRIGWLRPLFGLKPVAKPHASVGAASAATAL